MLPAAAHGDFRGTVLAIQPSTHEAIVISEKTAGHPRVTHAYRLSDADMKKLHVGDVIAGVVNDEAKPEALTDVYVTASTYMTAPVRQVPVLKIGQQVPNTPLVNQNGQPFNLTTFRGQNIVLAFIYTRCKGARECPFTTGKFAELQGILAKKNEDTHLVEVTLDPQYDSPSVLKKYGEKYGSDDARWTFGTGDTNNVLNVDAAFGLQPFADPKVGIIHGETLAIIDRAGAIRNLVYTNSWQPSEIIAELNTINGGFGNPIERLNLWLSRMAVALCGDNVSGFSGVFDLAVVIIIFGAVGYGFYRLYRMFAAT